MNLPDKEKSNRSKRQALQLKVKASIKLTPNMRRVTLAGDVLSDFPQNAEGAYIKLLFAQAGSDKPIRRTYTIAQQRSAENEIDVDFMLHTNAAGAVHGIAAAWSDTVQSGDVIVISGPGPAKFINLDAAQFLLAADMTALPALTANLRLLPDNARGQVFIEILSDEDKQTLPLPDNMELTWIINADPGSEASPLFQAIEQSQRATGMLAAWVACEFKTMRKIRQLLKEERAVEKSRLYISSYWKMGSTEEQHKAVKQVDAQLSDV